jgi:hypothetical protein
MLVPRFRIECQNLDLEKRKSLRDAEQWTIDLSQPGEIERKVEECIWTATILYGIGGWSKEDGLKADFFL